MSRSRIIEITESLEQLDRLERESTDETQRQRIAVLRLIKQYPTMTQKIIAEEIGVAERTVKRWEQLYREGGAPKLLLQATLDSEVASGRPHSPAAPIALSEFITFANTLPCSGDFQEMSKQIAGTLRKLFRDVDRVTVVVNGRCDLREPAKYSPDMIVFQQQVADDHHLEVREFSEEGVITSVVNSMKSGNFPVADYSPPASFIYDYGGAFLGVVLLWRELARPPISSETLLFMDSIKPFMIYIFSDIVARYAYGSPVDTAYQDVLKDLSVQTGLSIPERRVLVQLLSGVSYEDAAKALYVSVNTVKTHARSVFTKTETHDLRELFGKYFTPRLTPSELKKGKKK